MGLRLERTETGRRVFVRDDPSSTNGDEPTGPLAAIDKAVESVEASVLAAERAILGDGVLSATRHANWDSYDHRPTVVTNRHDSDVVMSLLSYVRQHNDPPNTFSFGDAICRERERNGKHALEPMSRNILRDQLEMGTRPVRRTLRGNLPTSYTPTVLDLALLRLQNDVLPIVDFVTDSAYVRSDGSVCTSAGYDPIGRATVSRVPDGLTVPDVPTAEDVAAAVAVIGDFLHDFPFVDESDKASMHALLLTITGRPMFDLVPLFLISGNGMGVGKNLLAECCVRITTGAWPGTYPLALDSEEQRKALTAVFREGRPVVLFDEVHILSGASIARAVTSTTWEDRLLGYSEAVHYPNKRTLVALGNNTSVQGDLPRRVLLSRVHSDLEVPYQRTDFRHGNLRAWVEEHEAALLGALLTLWRYWSVSGRPRDNTACFGSFEGWAATIAGVLDLAGVGGFLGNVDVIRQDHADDDNEAREHVHELWGCFGSAPFSSRQVVAALEDQYDTALESYPPGFSFRSRPSDSAKALGYAYKRVQGRWFGDLKLVKDGTTQGSNRWRVVQRGDDAAPRKVKIVIDRSKLGRSK